VPDPTARPQVQAILAPLQFAQEGFGTNIYPDALLSPIRDGAHPSLPPCRGVFISVEIRNTTTLAAPDRQTLLRPRPSASRILVVDDHADSRDLLAAFLMMEGHDVCAASDGSEALRICADFQPDIVFLDLCMPTMDGYEVCARLRENAATKDAAIYALTAYPNDGAPANAPLRVFDAYLLKPVVLEDVARVIARRAETASPSPA
jgi:CheY-like chemotaxis protein